MTRLHKLKPPKHHRKGGPVGRPTKGDLCLDCAAQARMHVTHDITRASKCAQCNREYVIAKRNGTENAWLEAIHEEYAEARAYRDRLLMFPSSGRARIAELAKSMPWNIRTAASRRLNEERDRRANRVRKTTL